MSCDLQCSLVQRRRISLQHSAIIAFAKAGKGEPFGYTGRFAPARNNVLEGRCRRLWEFHRPLAEDA